MVAEQHLIVVQSRAVSRPLIRGDPAATSRSVWCRRPPICPPAIIPPRLDNQPDGQRLQARHIALDVVTPPVIGVSPPTRLARGHDGQLQRDRRDQCAHVLPVAGERREFERRRPNFRFNGQHPDCRQRDDEQCRCLFGHFEQRRRYLGEFQCRADHCAVAASHCPAAGQPDRLASRPRQFQRGGRRRHPLLVSLAV